MQPKTLYRGVLAALVFAISGGVTLALHAEDLQNEDGTVSWGPLSVHPVLEVRMVWDDNIYHQENDKHSSFVTIISPDLGLNFDTSMEYGTEFGFKAGAEYVGYDNGIDDGYLNLHALFEADSELADGLGFYGNIGWELGHDPIGTGTMQGPGALYYDEAAEYELWWITGELNYAFSSRDELNFKATREEREYQNYRTTIDGGPGLGALRDVIATSMELTFKHQIQPNTSGVAGVRWVDYDYQTRPWMRDRDTGAYAFDPVTGRHLYASDMDSEELGYFVGLEWDISYQTEGYAHVGWAKKDMKDPALSDGELFNWEVGINWKPLSYSTVHVGGYGRFEEADIGAPYLEVTGVEAAWNHNWTSYIRSEVWAGYEQQEYKDYFYRDANSGGIFDDRTDEIVQFGVGLHYQMRRWLTVGAEYSYANVDSDVPGYSYEDNRFEIVLRAGLFDAIGAWTRGGVL